MKNYILTVLFTIVMVLNLRSQETRPFTLDSGNLAIVLFDTAKAESLHLQKCNASNLSGKEIMDIGKILSPFIVNYNKSDTCIWYGGELNLSRYKFQIVPVLNDSQEKLVWINAFCDSLGFNWKNEVVEINDGGNCYFNLVINVFTKEVTWFHVNSI